MLNQLWSSAQQDPPLAIAFVLMALLAVWAIGLTAIVVLDGRRAGTTTADELRKDAHTPERRARLRRMQARLGLRRAS
jgi:hypothetical protein